MNINDYKLWTALITPLNADGTVDFETLKALIKMQEDAKNGILILGSTGEAINLNLVEKKEIIKFVMNLKPSVPLMAGVGGINLEETKDWINYLNDQNFAAYLLVTPLYAKPGTKGQYYWFKELMDTATRPCMLYNIPSRAGVSLSIEAYSMLKGHKNLWALKEASGDTKKFDEYVKTNRDVLVFSGDDALMPAFSKLNAAGLVSVASNVWPAATNKYVKKCLNGSLSINDEKLWMEASNSLFIASNPVPVKALMQHHKMIKTNLLRPPLSNEDLKDISPLIALSNDIKHWNEFNL